MNADELRWRAESDARTLKEYAQIQKDPGRLEAAQKFLKDEMEAVADVMGLKEALKEMYAQAKTTGDAK